MFEYPMYGNTYLPNYQQRPYQPQFPAMQPQQTLTRVTGMEGAKAYQMAPNSVVALFDGDNDVFYVKSTDGAGFPTIKAFSFAPLETAPAQSEFVTRAEFEELKGLITNGKQSVWRKAEPADEPS
jgi:hypothetical protein